MLDKSRKRFSCFKADHEDKKQMLGDFIDARRLLLIGRKGMHYTEVYTYPDVEK